LLNTNFPKVPPSQKYMKTNNYHVEFDLDFKRNPYKGKLIAIEGIDGSGKTTQAQELKKYFKKNGNGTFFTKNPTDGEIGKFIRQILRGQKHFSPISFQYLFVADRAYQQSEISEHLKNGHMAITDRYFWSSVAYGAQDRNIDFSKGNGEVLLSSFGILSTYYQFIVPDMTFYLKISPETALERISKERDSKDIYDQKSKLVNIAKGYEWLINKFPEEFTVINGERPIDQITKEILSKLK